MAGVFISYRRDDSPGHAGRIFDSLRGRLGADLAWNGSVPHLFRVHCCSRPSQPRNRRRSGPALSTSPDPVTALYPIRDPKAV